MQSVFFGMRFSQQASEIGDERAKRSHRYDVHDQGDEQQCRKRSGSGKMRSVGLEYRATPWSTDKTHSLNQSSMSAPQQIAAKRRPFSRPPDRDVAATVSGRTVF
jgi:hypothetical protein